MIEFNIPPYVGKEMDYVREAAEVNRKICGDGPFTKRCHAWLEERFGANKALLTTSGSSALDMSAILAEIKPGDEVILPSFTFSSTATAFANVGATLVFVDVRPDTMNIDETLIEPAITDKTRAIIPVHYAGVSCEMDTIMAIAQEHGLLVCEDAAQGVMSTYKGRALGTIGDFGCYSFHETKNYSMGEGGAICIRDEKLGERAEIIREKGTDRSRFLRGQVDKYTWVDLGSSFLPSDMNAAYLWAQLEMADEINEDRLATWHAYNDAFADLAARERIVTPTIPAECTHNAHMYYLKCRDLADRTAFIAHMKERGVGCVFHYIPLHSAPAGLKFGRFHGKDVYTTADSDRLVRLPMYYGVTLEDRATVIESALEYFEQNA
ncbi:MAG: dTDP-4-amino-4,6-dideoxygalactose transaminase [Eggerthellaceae bacterium]|nr:dTDP-4-amino-4,6-dideoxygalactose transaminase [Eggerthellaceae bacterium]